MLREIYITMPNTAENWIRPAKPPKRTPLKFTQPVTSRFPIEGIEDAGDWLDIEADAIEALLRLIRRRDRVLRRHEPLAKVGAYRPTGCETAISAMSANELHVLVGELRERAGRARAATAPTISD